VTQVLEPTIGNYFRNAAQGRDAIDFLKEREQRQRDARDTISAALHEYNVGAVDTLIGDITPPPDLMKTLTDRKIAQQQKVTFDVQRDAQEARKALAQAQAIADTQPSVVTAERSVEIAQFAANATIKKAEGEAKSKTVVAEADAMVTRTVGGAVAERTLKVGTAEADVIKLKIASMESSNYALIETAKALAGSGFKLVPDIVAGGGGGSEGSSSLVNVLIARLIHDGLRSGSRPLDPPVVAVMPVVDIPPAPEPPAKK
jgi:regulator of protease activity HflC (stomatin/prohibitin superfamily)